MGTLEEENAKLERLREHRFGLLYDLERRFSTKAT